MPITKSQTLPPPLPSPPLASGPKPPGIDTLSPLRGATINTSTVPPSPSSPNKHIPPRPSPLARASTLLVSHLPPNLQNLHFELPPALANFEVPQLTLPTLQGFLARFASHTEDDVDPIVPEIVGEGYEPLGHWKFVFGFNCYVVGPDPSINCLVGVFDIFGFSLPTLQGADVLHKLTGATVYLPDFFRGQPFPSTSFPPTTTEQSAQLNEFFLTKANIDDRRDELVEFGHELLHRFKGEPWADSTKVAAYGLSWGGKITFLAGSQTTPFYAVASITPAMLALPDAEALKVPVGVFPSKDEPTDTALQMVDAFRRKTFSSKCVCKPFPTMPHGFASARSNLLDPLVRTAFSELYVATASFLRSAGKVEGAASSPVSPTRGGTMLGPEDEAEGVGLPKKEEGEKVVVGGVGKGGVVKKSEGAGRKKSGFLTWGKGNKDKGREKVKRPAAVGAV